MPKYTSLLPGVSGRVESIGHVSSRFSSLIALQQRIALIIGEIGQLRLILTLAKQQHISTAKFMAGKVCTLSSVICSTEANCI